MWTCYPPMHFSVHIMAHILQKQLVWPRANSIFLASGNKGLSVKLARPEILQRQETKQELVLCLQQSFPLAWQQFAHWTTGTFSATILLANGLKRTFSPVRRICFPWLQCHSRAPRRRPFRQGLSTQHHAKKYYQITMNLKPAMMGHAVEKNSFTSEFLITSKAHVWSSNNLGTSLPVGLLLVGVSLLPAAPAIL